MNKNIFCLLFPILISTSAFSQQDTIMYFEEYDPPSSLIVPEHITVSAKYPFVDAHNHQFDLSPERLDQVVADMDALNMSVMVNLSGRGFSRVEVEPGVFEFGIHDSDYLKDAIATINENYPGRIITFTNIDFRGFGESWWLERALGELELDVSYGAKGLKIYKNLGLTLVDNNGNRVAVDDPRLDPVWEKCAELEIPVLIHSGEPFQFWLPKDKNNAQIDTEILKFIRPGKKLWKNSIMFSGNIQTLFLLMHTLVGLGLILKDWVNSLTDYQTYTPKLVLCLQSWEGSLSLQGSFS